jgi:hypothetical protein
MRKTKLQAWAVYQTPMRGSRAAMRAVCRQDEWEALDLASPGVNTLIAGHLTNEGEAERLARGMSGHTPTKAEKEKARFAASEGEAGRESRRVMWGPIGTAARKSLTGFSRRPRLSK